MRYALDIRDRSNVYGIGTVMECSPSFSVMLDEPVDAQRLCGALCCAFEALPYFKTKLVFDGRFLLESNDAELPVYHCRFEDRPHKFGKSGGDYTFQISYYENTLSFDMSHFPNDTLGFLYFIKAVVAAYFGVKLSFDPELYLKLPFEESYDEEISRPKVRTQAQGFRPERIASIPAPCASSRCTLLSTPLKGILSYRKRVDASPAAIISALVAVTLRAHLQKSSAEYSGENNNVRGKIVASTRKALDISTVHNCYQQTFITHTDAFDKFDFSSICSIYRAILDLEVQEECAFYDVKQQVEALRPMEEDPDQAQVWEKSKLDAIEARKQLCNYNFSYFGDVSFDSRIAGHIVDFRAVCLNENCDFGIFAYAFGERLYLMFSDNYADREIISEFINISSERGIPFERITEFNYRQALFELPDSVPLFS